MSFLRAICRVIVGFVFLVSGFLKAIDPIGTSLKVKEYLSAFHLDFLDSLALPGGIMLCCFEFLVGISVLKGLRIRLFTMLSFYLSCFFTVVTLATALFTPIKDCGCFGELIHITSWETFYKNLVLLLCSFFIYKQRGKFIPIATHFWQNLYAISYLIFIAIVSIYSLFYLPQADFGMFKSGTDLIEKLSGNRVHEYNTVLIYSKDGVEKEFTLENIPDSTWTFVDSKSTLISQAGAEEIIDFSIRNEAQELVTDSILNLTKPIILVSFYKNATPDNIKNVESFAKEVANAGGELFLINATPNIISTSLPIYTMDYKTTLSLNRGDGGATYVMNGRIIEKWSRYRYPSDIKSVFNDDYEIVIANTIIKEQMFIYFVIAILILMVVIIRTISKRVYRGYLNKKKAEASEDKRIQ